MQTDLKNILISYSQPDFRQKLATLRQKIIDAATWPEQDPKNQILRDIIQTVRKDGNKAVAQFTKDFDNVDFSPAEFMVPPNEIKQAHSQIDPQLLQTIRQSIANVKKYQQEIFTGTNLPGKVKYTPIKRVGLCIPGASAPLPSTVIMTAVPAQVAGVKQIAVISPPRHKGSIHPVILTTCCELGITEVYRIGGAQAVAMLACGTQTVKKVDKIVGPGNQWVQMAKKQVFGSVDIDSVAGPSEVLIIADKNANPAWLAADMLSQAEHDPGSAILFTDSQTIAENTLSQLQKQLTNLDRTAQTTQCLEKYSGIVIFENFDELIDSANDFAAEHLQIQCGPNSDTVAEKIENAGAIFIGEYSPVAAGDYWAGPSHTLPTGTTAKFFSPLSSNDFVKSSSIIKFDKQRLTADGPQIIRLAATEGLDAHAKSISIRLEE